jgi:transcriptional regulator with XRE-family HTH domain
MDDSGEVYIGQRIRYWRGVRGKTQQQLADEVGIARSAVAMAETGQRPIDSRGLLYRLAEALQVSVGDLTGQADEKVNPNVREFHAHVPRIETALMVAGDTDLPGRLPTARQLAAAADEALAVRAATQYQRLGGMLPDLITGLYQRAATDRDPQTAWGGLVKALGCTALATKGLGHTSTAWIAAQGAVHAAQQTGTAADRAFAGYMRAQVMLATPGAVASSLAYTRGLIDVLEPDVASPADREQWGMLHLHAGLTASALGQNPADHLAAADVLAERTGEGATYSMFFGPSNIHVWRMSMALERREGGEVLRLAEQIDPRSIDSADRKSRYFIERARGQFMEGDTAGAQTSILHAEHIAPLQARTRTTVRELVGAMIRQARRDLGSSELGRLAQRVGAVPA